MDPIFLTDHQHPLLDHFEFEDSMYSSPPAEEMESRIKKAAKTVMQINSLANLLQDPRLERLTEAAFLKWLKIAAPLIENGLQDPTTTSFTQKSLFLLLSKRTHSEKEAIPIFHSFGFIEDGTITTYPKYDWICSESHPTRFIGLDEKNIDLHAGGPVRRSFFFRKVSESQLVYSQATAENLLAAFKYISSKDCLAWEYKINMCYARATASIEYLLSLGFQKERLFTALLVGNNIGYATAEVFANWRFHIAAGMELEDGSQYVIDLSSYQDTPLTLFEWSDLSTCRREQIINPPEILDRRKSFVSSEELTEFEQRATPTIILLPSNTTCWNLGPQIPLKTIPSTPKDIITSHLDNRAAFAAITLQKTDAEALEESFAATPHLLSALNSWRFLLAE